MVTIMATDDDFTLTGFEPWDRAATRAYLDANPLPPTFTWKHRDGGQRPVHPSHKQVTGYGKWLHETPYFPGLFELIHGILALSDAHTKTVGDAVWLAAELERRRPAEQPPLF